MHTIDAGAWRQHTLPGHLCAAGELEYFIDTIKVRGIYVQLRPVITKD